eukprot:jgi/Antlo1/539/41
MRGRTFRSGLEKADVAEKVGGEEKKKKQTQHKEPEQRVEKRE